MFVVPRETSADKLRIEVGAVLGFNVSDCAAVAVSALAGDGHYVTEDERGGEILSTSSPRLIEFRTVDFCQSDADLVRAIQDGNGIAIADADDARGESLGESDVGGR